LTNRDRSSRNRRENRIGHLNCTSRPRQKIVQPDPVGNCYSDSTDGVFHNERAQTGIFEEFNWEWRDWTFSVRSQQNQTYQIGWQMRPKNMFRDASMILRANAGEEHVCHE
jgi:hypothetical protein